MKVDKTHAFIKTFGQTETLKSVKLGYLSLQGLLSTICSDKKFFRSMSEL